jgi:hypothetical protein
VGTYKYLDIAHVLTVLSVNEVGVFVIDMQDVSQHAQHQSGDGKDLAEGAETKRTGDGNEERHSQTAEENPPLDTPDGGDDGHQHRHHAEEHDEHGAGDEGLLNGLVDEVDVAMKKGMGNLGQHAEQTLNLSGHPAHTLALEIVLRTDLLVEDMDVGGIFDKDILTQQEGFHLTILTSGG